jgi:hypothetical protein
MTDHLRKNFLRGPDTKSDFIEAQGKKITGSGAAAGST